MRKKKVPERGIRCQGMMYGCVKILKRTCFGKKMLHRGQRDISEMNRYLMARLDERDRFQCTVLLGVIMQKLTVEVFSPAFSDILGHPN